MEAKTILRDTMREQLSDICMRIQNGEKLSDEDRSAILKLSKESLHRMEKDE